MCVVVLLFHDRNLSSELTLAAVCRDLGLRDLMDLSLYAVKRTQFDIGMRNR